MSVLARVGRTPAVVLAGRSRVRVGFQIRAKHGDAVLRSLLYEAANSLLTRVGRAHPLKDWARRIKRRSGHQKACVALARQLAGSRGLRGFRPRSPFTLHRMLMTGEAFRWPDKQAATTG